MNVGIRPNALPTRALCVASLVVVALVLIPHEERVELFHQNAPGLKESATLSRETDTVRLTPGHAVRQRLWLPDDVVDAVEMYYDSLEAGPLAIEVHLYGDREGSVGEEIIQQTEVLSVEHTRPHTLHIPLMSLPRERGDGRWIWVELRNHSPRGTVFFFREIDSASYPGGRLILEPSSHSTQGVLAFTLLTHRTRWMPLRSGVALLGMLLVAWVILQIFDGALLDSNATSSSPTDERL